MRHRLLGPIALAATLVSTAANESSILAAQEGTVAGKPVENKSSIPRMADGRPDLQGVWTNFESTPVEAPSPEDSARLAPLEPWFPGISRPAINGRSKGQIRRTSSMTPPGEARSDAP